MLNLLGWPTLESRRYISRLTQSYKIMHHHTHAIHLLPYYLPTQYPTRHLHQYQFILPAISTTAYQQSFFLKTIKQWNNLPDNIIESSSIQHFVAAITTNQVLFEHLLVTYLYLYNYVTLSHLRSKAQAVVHN